MYMSALMHMRNDYKGQALYAATCAGRVRRQGGCCHACQVAFGIEQSLGRLAAGARSTLCVCVSYVCWHPGQEARLCVMCACICVLPITQVTMKLDQLHVYHLRPEFARSIGQRLKARCVSFFHARHTAGAAHI